MIVSIPVSTFEDRANFAKPWEQIPQLDGLYVAGGSCRKLFLGQFQDSDVDVFATSKEVLESCREKLEASGFVLKWGNDTVVELHRATTKVQLIGIAFYPTVEALLESFDFTICQFTLSADRTQLIATPAALIDAARKRLVLNSVTYAVATMKRLWKYKSQGFEPCNGTYKKFCELVKANDVNITTNYID